MPFLLEGFIFPLKPSFLKKIDLIDPGKVTLQSSGRWQSEEKVSQCSPRLLAWLVRPSQCRTQVVPPALVLIFPPAPNWMSCRCTGASLTCVTCCQSREKYLLPKSRPPPNPTGPCVTAQPSSWVLTWFLCDLSSRKKALELQGSIDNKCTLFSLNKHSLNDPLL